MSEIKTIDAKQIVGIFPLCNTGTVLVYAIDYAEDRVLAGINENPPEWCTLIEEYCECSEELELGFRLGTLFVPLYEVQRFYTNVG